MPLDWLTFDEGYGKAPEFVCGLDERKLRFRGRGTQEPVVPGGQRLRRRPDATVKGRRPRTWCGRARPS